MKTTYKEHDIIFHPDRMMFSIPSLSADQRFESVRAAEKAIDDNLAVKQLQMRKAQFSFELVTESGEVVIVRGINAGTSNILGPKGYEDGTYYPNVPWLRDLLFERVRLINRLEAIRLILREFSISGRRGYGRLDPQDYQRMIDELREECQHVLEEAIKRERLLHAKEQELADHE